MSNESWARYRWIKFNLILSLVVFATFPIAALGTRYGLWDYVRGLQLIRWEAYLGIFVIIFSLLLLVCLLFSGTKKGLGLLILSLACVLVVLAPLSYQYYLVNKLPKIHDITTDTKNPPQFQTVVDQRPRGSNNLIYGGALIAEQQHLAYPNIVPIITDEDTDDAYESAIDVAQALGWQIIAADEGQGIIEATDTSFWFGFTDDIVIRIAPDDSGSRVDIRSVSRVGLSDIGANAARIERFAKRFEDEVN